MRSQSCSEPVPLDRELPFPQGKCRREKWMCRTGEDNPGLKARSRLFKLERCSQVALRWAIQMILALCPAHSSSPCTRPKHILYFCSFWVLDLPFKWNVQNGLLKSCPLDSTGEQQSLVSAWSRYEHTFGAPRNTVQWEGAGLQRIEEFCNYRELVALEHRCECGLIFTQGLIRLW